MSERTPLLLESFSGTFRFPNRELAERAVIMMIKIFKGDIGVYTSFFIVDNILYQVVLLLTPDF